MTRAMLNEILADEHLDRMLFVSVAVASGSESAFGLPPTSSLVAGTLLTRLLSERLRTCGAGAVRTRGGGVLNRYLLGVTCGEPATAAKAILAVLAEVGLGPPAGDVYMFDFDGLAWDSCSAPGSGRKTGEEIAGLIREASAANTGWIEEATQKLNEYRNDSNP